MSRSSRITFVFFFVLAGGRLGAESFPSAAMNCPEPTWIANYLEFLQPPTVEAIIAAIEPIPSILEALEKRPLDPDDPPTAGDTAVEARILVLQRDIQDLRQAACYADAAELARQLLDRCMLLHRDPCEPQQILEHMVWNLEEFGALPEEARQELARSDIAYAELEQLRSKARFEEARREACTLIAIRQGILGRDHPALAEGLEAVGRLMRDLGRFADAERLYREAWRIYQSRFGTESIEASGALCGIAIARRNQSQNVDAIKLLSSALVSRRRIVGDADRSIADVLTTLGSVLEQGGAHSEAEFALREALAIRRLLFHDPAENLAVTLNELGVLLRNGGKSTEARPLYEESLDINRRVYGDESVKVALSLHNIGVLLRGVGDPRGAEERLREALVIYQKFLGEKHHKVGQTMFMLSLVLNDQGRHEEADGWLRQAVTIQTEAMGRTHWLSAMMLRRLAQHEIVMKNFDQAEALISEAYKAVHDEFGDHHRYTHEAQMTIADLHWSKNEPEKAEAVYRELIDRVERKWSPSPSTFQFASSSLVAVLVELGKIEEAFETLEQYNSSELLGLLASTQDDLTEKCRENSWSAACALLEIAKGVEQKAREGVLAAERKLSQSESPVGTGEGSDAEAVECLRKDLARQRETLRDAELQMWLRLQDIWPDSRPETSERIRNQLRPGELLVVFNWRRTGTLLIVPPLNEGDIIAHQVASDKDTMAEVSDLADRVRHDLARTGPARDDPAAFERRCELCSRLFPDPILQRLMAAKLVVLIPSGPIYDLPIESLVLPPWALKKGALGREWIESGPTVVYTDSASVFIRTRQEHGPAVPRVPKTRSAVILADPDFGLSREIAGLPKHGLEIVTIVDGSRAAAIGLKAGDILVGYGDSELTDFASLVQALEDEAKSPIEPSEATDVEVRYWREGQFLSGRVSPGALGVKVREEPAVSRGAFPFAARGLKQYAEHAGLLREIKAFDGPLPSLPGTRREANIIMDLIKRSGGQVTCLFGSEAELTKLEAALPGAAILHLATHGMMGTDSQPFHASLALAQLRSPNPGSLSFLSLDRLLQHWHGRLQECELVVLSACDTQRGIRKDASRLALPWGFLYAGSPSVIASLWKVDDAATARFMQRFYENLLGEFDEPRAGYLSRQPMTKADGLREAKVWLRRHVSPDSESAVLRGGMATTTLETMPAEKVDYSDPYYWAAFVLIGSPE